MLRQSCAREIGARVTSSRGVCWQGEPAIARLQVAEVGQLSTWAEVEEAKASAARKRWQEALEIYRKLDMPTEIRNLEAALADLQYQLQ